MPRKIGGAETRLPEMRSLLRKRAELEGHRPPMMSIVVIAVEFVKKIVGKHLLMSSTCGLFLYYRAAHKYHKRYTPPTWLTQSLGLKVHNLLGIHFATGSSAATVPVYSSSNAV